MGEGWCDYRDAALPWLPSERWPVELGSLGKHDSRVERDSGLLYISVNAFLSEAGRHVCSSSHQSGNGRHWRLYIVQWCDKRLVLVLCRYN